MSVLARSCAALALTALAAGVVTIAPAGVAAASRDGASAFGTTEPQPNSQTVRTPKQTTRGAATKPPIKAKNVCCWYVQNPGS
jgi:hypothetical protein